MTARLHRDGYRRRHHGTWALLIGMIGMVFLMGDAHAVRRAATGTHKRARARTESDKMIITAPVLDLSGGGTAPKAAGVSAPVIEEARPQRVLRPAQDRDDHRSGVIDFGGGFELDLSGVGKTNAGLDLTGQGLVLDARRGGKRGDPDSRKFQAGIAKLSAGDIAGAALVFAELVNKAKDLDVAQDAQYMLAKSVYALGFQQAALQRFQAILAQGNKHRRYLKAVEWLFVIRRELTDDMPVLAELAQWRHAKLPESYQAEYNYLMAKYLFRQASRLEVDRLRAEALRRQKTSKEATIDFSKLLTQLGKSGADKSWGLDWGTGGSKRGASGSDGGFDFGGSAIAVDRSGGGDGRDGSDSGGPSTGAIEAIRQALDLIHKIPNTDGLYPRARYLQGLLYVLKNADQHAVTAFHDVIRVLHPKTGTFRDLELRDMAFLSLARLHYGHNQFDRSVHYYDLIDKDSSQWLTALMESSWASYRRGDLEKSLGNLVTLRAPFFADAYFPESHLVESIIYFEACRYAETREKIDAFLQMFTRVLEIMQKVAELDAASEELYAQIQAIEQRAQQENDEAAQRVVQLTLNDEEIELAHAVLQENMGQLRALEALPSVFQGSAVGKEIRARLNENIRRRQRVVGRLTRKKLEEEEYNLKGLLAQGIRIKIEVTRAEREHLEAKLQGTAGDVIIAAIPNYAVDDEHTVWPYEGEYWRDELGTYALDFSRCAMVEEQAE